ncbi:MAG: ribokinase [Acidobacteria bacterium]|nr:ribokinase [Acidobacteriota bacterium]
MNAAQILNALPNLSALVVGDICLDRWCTYDPATAEPSRETGIPRLGVVATEATPGAGGTVANNLAALGVGRVAVLGVTGDDGFAFELRRALEARRIEAGHLIAVPGWQTFTYTKIIHGPSGVEDQPRVDFINTRPLEAEVERRLAGDLRALAGGFDAILVADQAETQAGGVVTPALRDELAELAARSPEKVVWIDSRLRCDLFRHAIVKPNQQEAEAACRRLFGRIDYQALRRRAEAPLLLVTHGGDGVLLVSETGEEWISTRRVEHPVDICGAGDSFSAGAAMAFAATRSPAAAARFGNLVASLTIMKKGTGTASPREVLQAAHAYSGD